jgi:hypothetical protein
MVLAGHVHDYPLAEMLFFLSSKQRTGQLILKRSEMKIVLMLHRGRLIAAQMIPGDRRLGERLLEDGTISHGELSLALQCQQEHAPALQLGSILVDLDLADRETILRALRAQIADCLVTLLVAPGGTFAFHEKTIDPGRIDVDVIVEREVLDAIRRADEYVARQIDTGPLRLNPDVNPRTLQPFILDNWDVIDALLGGAQTVDELVAETLWERERVVSSLCQLQASGTITLGAEGGAPISRP